MANFVAQATNNWTSETTWGTSAGQGEGVTYPGPNDNVDLAGYTVTANIARIPSSGYLGNVTSTVSGAGVTGVAGVITGAITTFTGFYCAVINPSHIGGAQITTTGTSANAFTFEATTVNAGDVASNNGFYRNTATGACSIKGAFHGGVAVAGNGFKNNASTGTLTVDAASSFEGGDVNASYGWTQTANASGGITVPCPVTGGGHTGGLGLYSSGTTVFTFQDTTLTSVTGRAFECTGATPTVHGCNLIYGTAPVFSGKTPTFVLDATNYFRFGTEGNYVYVAAVPAAADLKDGVWCGNVEGTLTSGGYGIL